MGQKANPIANRLGFIKGWDSNWYGGKDYSVKLEEDSRIRDYLNARLAKASISKIIIERTLKLITVTVNTARPGIIIGKKGAEVEKLKVGLEKMTDREIYININEVRKPETDAQLIAENVAQQLERRVGFRRAMKRCVNTALKLGAQGVKIACAGRLAGAEMARREWYREGRMPLHTLRAEIDYGFPNGILGEE